jgi:hypothetical protein
MKDSLINFISLVSRTLLLGCIFVAPSFSYAGDNDDEDHISNLPSETLQHVMSYLEMLDLQKASHTSKYFRDNAIAAKTQKWREKVQKLNALMGEFIPLPATLAQDGAAISSIGISQSLWVEVLGKNPSVHKRAKDCPKTHKKLNVTGNSVELCADFPVENIVPADEEEFYAKLNRTYSNAGSNIRFRQQRATEFYWVDSNNGRNPKRSTDPDYLKCISCQRNSRNESGELVPSSVFDKEPNSLGFYRNSVYEMTTSKTTGGHILLVGGSYLFGRKDAHSGVSLRQKVKKPWTYIGPSRLVKITGISDKNTELDSDLQEFQEWLSKEETWSLMP